MSTAGDLTLGVTTFQTRVERWECDFNDHWNARFYARSFQQAAERVVTLAGLPNPGMAAVASRHVRFHRELLLADAVAVRSMRIESGAHAGAVVHLLGSGGRLAATALDRPRSPADHLPGVAADAVTSALPRSDFAQALGWDERAPDAFRTETGIVRPAEVDHTGTLLYEEIVRRTAVATHANLNRFGFTPAFTKETGIGRMAVESRVVLAGEARPGSVVVVRSRVSAVARKSLSTRHWLETQAGEPIATVDHSVVAVDLERRRVVDLPDFVRGAARGDPRPT